jgi:hypothetical protein
LKLLNIFSNNNDYVLKIKGGIKMIVRQPIVAGQFYGGSRDKCIGQLEECLSKSIDNNDLPEVVRGIVVPHAGWVFSGATAGLAFQAVKKINVQVDTFVLLGAGHRYSGNFPAVYNEGKWASPLGEIEVDSDLGGSILQNCSKVGTDLSAHNGEHSIEVQVPFVQYLFEGSKILPVIVPPTEDSISFGSELGEFLQDCSKSIVLAASTDLTHYGPGYGFCPQGKGPGGIEWAKEVNDAEFIDFLVNLESKKALDHSIANYSACGGGAAAVVAEAVRKLGVYRGKLLEHTHSSEILQNLYGQSSTESVGYASIVF